MFRSVWDEDFIALAERVVVGDVVIGAADLRDADGGVDDFLGAGAMHIQARRDDVDEHRRQLQAVADHPHELRPGLRKTGAVVMPQIMLLGAVVAVDKDFEACRFDECGIVHTDARSAVKEPVPHVESNGDLIHVLVLRLRVDVVGERAAVAKGLGPAVEGHLFHVLLRSELGLLVVGVDHVDGLDELRVDEPGFRRQFIHEEQQFVPAGRVRAHAARTDFVLPHFLEVDGPDDVFRTVAAVVGLIGAEVETRQPHEPLRAEVTGNVRARVHVRPAAEQTGFVIDEAVGHPDVDLGMDTAAGDVEEHLFQHAGFPLCLRIKGPLKQRPLK
ncbi:MAG: hypothetical protein E7567_04785 [Ruminococcaceae bacterium]|nr:hypothetical protein [Oscillospiraceae bacterium]